MNHSKLGLYITSLLTLVIALSSCNSKKEGIQVGMKTWVMVDSSKVLPPQKAISELFLQSLQVPDRAHFPGKALVIDKDTVYTSSMNYKGKLTAPAFIPENAIAEGSMETDGIQSLLLKEGNLEIYRTIVPEPDFSQVIILDIISSDTSRINRLFSDQKILKFLDR